MGSDGNLARCIFDCGVRGFRFLVARPLIRCVRATGLSGVLCYQDTQREHKGLQRSCDPVRTGAVLNAWDSGSIFWCGIPWEEDPIDEPGIVLLALDQERKTCAPLRVLSPDVERALMIPHCYRVVGGNKLPSFHAVDQFLTPALKEDAVNV